jgi:hypothetical protein
VPGAAEDAALSESDMEKSDAGCQWGLDLLRLKSIPVKPANTEAEKHGRADSDRFAN